MKAHRAQGTRDETGNVAQVTAILAALDAGQELAQAVGQWPPAGAR